MTKRIEEFANMEKVIPCESIVCAKILLLKASIKLLEEKYNSNKIVDIKSYQVVILNRIYQSMQTLATILSQYNDPVSSYGLLRVIIDSICTYCFIYDNKDNEEVEFRHYLYLLDGCSKYNELCSVALKNNQMISKAERSQFTKDTNFSIRNMLLVEDSIKKLLYNHRYMSEYPDNAKRIIDAQDWKYKSIESYGNNNYYDWRGMYEKVGCDKGTADFVLKYLSQYVHGLFLSNIRNPKNIVHRSLIFNVLFTFLEKLLNTTFKIFREDIISVEFVKKINVDEFTNNENINTRDLLAFLSKK